MKRKHSGLLAFIIIFITVLVAVSYAIRKISENHNGTYMTRKITPLSEIAVPPLSVIREMEQLQRDTKGLLHPHGIYSAPVNLILFGYQPVEKSRFTLKTGSSGIPYRMDYNLSLAFVSAEKRFCMIDGVFYNQGSYLKDGAEIITVEPNRVLIRKRQIKQWIPLAEREIIKEEKK